MVAIASGLPRGRAAASPTDGWAAVASAIDRDERSGGRGRAWPTSRRVLVAVLVAVASPLAVLLLAPRSDLPVYPKARWIAEVALLACFAIAGVGLAMRPMQRARDPRWGTWLAVIAALGAISIASLPVAHHDHAASLAGASDDLLPRAIGCLVYGTVCAVPTWLTLRWLARDGDRLGGNAALVAVGAAAIGIVAVNAHCPIVHRAHLLVGHVTVFVLPAVWAWWVGRGAGPSRVRA